MAADSEINLASSSPNSGHSNSNEILDLVIVGGGPAGISAAIEAEKLGWKYVVLERSKIASTVRSFPPGKKVYAEPRSIGNESELDVSEDRDKDDFLEMIRDLVQKKQLHVKEDTEVARIRKNTDDEFDIELKNGKVIPCKKVIIAIGRQGQPRLLTVPGAEKSHKVTYRFHTVEDYIGKKVLIVGGGNSAIEAALALCETNDVTLSYRGDNFYRAKEENLELIESAVDSGKLNVIYDGNVTEIREDEVDIEAGEKNLTIPNDNLIVQIGTLPPIDFLHDIGIEMDGIWTKKRFVWSGVGIAVGIFLYFIAKNFVLLPEKAGDGRWHVPLLSWVDHPEMSVGTVNDWVLSPISALICYALPIPWLLLLGLVLINKSLAFKKKRPLYKIPGATLYLLAGLFLYYFNYAAPTAFTFDPAEAGNGPYHLPWF